MRDVHAIAAVTATLAGVIQRAVSARGADVTTSRPNRDVGTKPRVNVFLFHVVPNLSLRNIDLPTRRSDGSLIQDPRLALDLHYIISVYGPEDLPTLTNQVLLGLTLDALHVKPILHTGDVLDAIEGNPAFDDASNMTEAGQRVERVVLGMMPMEVDQLSRLWSMAFQAPYVLSVAYKASVAILSAGLTPQPALPVLERRFHVFQLAGPWLAGAKPEGGHQEPLLASSRLVVTGQGLDVPDLQLWLGDTLYLPSGAEEVDSARLVVALDAPADGAQALRAGLLPVRASIPSGSHSNTLVVILRPTLSAVRVAHSTPDRGGYGGILEATVNPPVAAGQKLAILLDETPPAASQRPRSYRFESFQQGAGATVEISFQGVAAGTYTVRLGVDDAESIPTAGPDGYLDVPSVTLPTKAVASNVEATE